jgi:hypothetical protein
MYNIKRIAFQLSRCEFPTHVQVLSAVNTKNVMFCWPRISIYACNETNLMTIYFSLFSHYTSTCFGLASSPSSVGCFCFTSSAAHHGPWPPGTTRFRDHTQRRATIDRTALDEWSPRRRHLYLTTHNTHNRQISMPPVGFETTIATG